MIQHCEVEWLTPWQEWAPLADKQGQPLRFKSPTKARYAFGVRKKSCPLTILQGSLWRVVEVHEDGWRIRGVRYSVQPRKKARPPHPGGEVAVTTAGELDVKHSERSERFPSEARKVLDISEPGRRPPSPLGCRGSVRPLGAVSNRPVSRTMIDWDWDEL